MYIWNTYMHMCKYVNRHAWKEICIKRYPRGALFAAVNLQSKIIFAFTTQSSSAIAWKFKVWVEKKIKRKDWKGGWQSFRHKHYLPLHELLAPQAPNGHSYTRQTSICSLTSSSSPRLCSVPLNEVPLLEGPLKTPLLEVSFTSR